MRPEKLVDLGILYPSPGFCSEIQYLFIARQLAPDRSKLDEDEIIEPEPLSLVEIDAAIKSGDLCDAKSIAAITKARLLEEL